MSLNAYASPGRRYKVHRPIGRGGFGTVYRADMLGDDGFVRAVALKVLNANVGDTAEVARRFRDEARVLGLLRHRAIVHVDGVYHSVWGPGRYRLWSGVGEVTVDAGAARALKAGKSLLPAGIKSVSGTFDRGDAIQVVDLEGRRWQSGWRHTGLGMRKE